jgi:hypothetical protein
MCMTAIQDLNLPRLPLPTRWRSVAVTLKRRSGPSFRAGSLLTSRKERQHQHRIVRKPSRLTQAATHSFNHHVSRS